MLDIDAPKYTIINNTDPVNIKFSIGTVVYILSCAELPTIHDSLVSITDGDRIQLCYMSQLQLLNLDTVVEA